ncbi:peptidoglycan-binding domain-containing protein [Salirhabdus sp. Marseille-P4669]|nr:peptidoglycan-binding domain-containing protein [Salirhabdus sp. Marseille-P4669]
MERIQRAVNVTVDGIFGPITESAVKNYQRRHGLTVDGIVGPLTWEVLF